MCKKGVKIAMIAMILSLGWSAATGCGGIEQKGHYEESIKTAYLFYTRHRQPVTPPRKDEFDWIEQEIGKARFVNCISKYVSTKYAPEALYCLAWFGTRNELPVVVIGLSSADFETRTMALLAFNRLSENTFSNQEEALRWWRSSRVGRVRRPESSGGGRGNVGSAAPI